MSEYPQNIPTERLGAEYKSLKEELIGNYPKGVGLYLYLP